MGAGESKGESVAVPPAPSPPSSVPTTSNEAVSSDEEAFKEEVRKYAVDHTFKETAKKFGIHHSTVSGWVKESEKQDKCANFGDFFREKGSKHFQCGRLF